MSKVEKMSIAEIMDETNLYLTLQSLYEIWKEPEQNPNQGITKTAFEMLEENTDLVYKLINNHLELYKFLIKHDNEIDKIKFIVTLLKNYKERLSIAGRTDITAEEREDMQNGVKAIKKLLQGIDKTYTYYDMSKTGFGIDHLIIMNTKEELEGKNRKDRNINVARLQELKRDAYLGNIVQGMIPSDIEDTVALDKKIGQELRYMIEYNTVLKEYGDKVDDSEFSRIVSEIDRGCFTEELIRALELHIEEVNFDKLLLCSAYRYMEGAEAEWIQKDEIRELKRRLEIIRKHIKKNVRIPIGEDEYYSLREFEQDLTRFVGNDKNVKYISKKEMQKFSNALLTGEITLNSLSVEVFKAISLERIVLTEILRNDPNNYIFFLRQVKCEYSKNTILSDIINTQKCSTDLLQLLCAKTDITAEEVSDLFEREIISVSDLNSVRNQIGTIITDEKMFEKYREYKETGNSKQEMETAKIQLERYALAYRNTELAGKTVQEIQDKGEEFITKASEEIETSDLVPLYKLDIIPLKVAVDWGGEHIIEELLESESLKPADARYLRDEGLLNEEVLERLFKNCIQMSYSYQVALVYAVFDGQTAEEQEIREKLAQYYHIENGMINSSTKGFRGKRNGTRNGQSDEPKQQIKMRDPGAKYNLLASIDKDVKIEEGIIDGHIIFRYPNIDEGTVLIEKLHRITTNKETGLIEIKADNQSATYVLSEEEFIKMKSGLIQDGKVDRTQLTQKWWVTRDPEHWLPHVGTQGWEKTITERFSINDKNQRYSQDDLKRIGKLIEKSIESKKRLER